MIYYLDAKANAGGNGISPETAWSKLEEANAHIFQPGDQLLLRRGCVWKGVTLTPQGSGTEEQPIIMDAYGDGDMPVIDRQGEFSETENSTEAICLTNQSYWTIRNLMVSNTNPTAPGEVEPPIVDEHKFAMFPLRHGLIIRATYREGVRRMFVRGIVIENCRAENIDGTNGDEGNNWLWVVNKGEAGVQGHSGSVCIGAIVTDNPIGKFRAHVDGIRIENCTVFNSAGCGVRLDSEAWRYRDSYRNVVIRGNNLFADEDYTSSHAGMYIVGAENALVEYNRFCHYANGQAYQNCNGGISRYNFLYDLTGKLSETAKIIGHQTYWDGMGFDVDSQCIGEFHIHSNVVAHMKDCGVSFFNFGTNSPCHITVENNVFFNSDWFFNHQIGAYGYTIDFKHNTFIRDKQNQYANSKNMMGHAHQPPKDNMYIQSNNLFYCPDQDMIFEEKATTYRDNLYFGGTDSLPAEGFCVKEPLLRIPAMAELEHYSYDGTIADTKNFCNTDWFTFEDASPASEENGVLYGADPVMLRAGDRTKP